MAGFGDVELVLLDLDGTVYEGSRPVPGAAAAVERLRRAGRALRFLTNTDSVPPAALVERLRGMGVEAAGEEVDRAAQKVAAASLLRKPIHLIEKPRCQRVAHENVVTYPGKKV